jgi:hypothetical protein
MKKKSTSQSAFFNLRVFPATPVQQRSWDNGADGLWRWMPSIAVDENGNMAIGYSVSSASMEPSSRYSGRLPSDPLMVSEQPAGIGTCRFV